ncbi:MAG: pyruvate, phosphate dikinase [Longimicrobiales bacterium]
MADLYAYHFGGGHADGSKEDKELLGGKGAGLAEMTRIGIPVPPGFTITTAVCRLFLKRGEYPSGLREQVAANLKRLEVDTGRRFGDAENPLLVSVRSGAASSMPGMMETILNLGLNDQTVEGIARSSANERFAYDSYRRFVNMYSDVVLGVPHAEFERLLETRKQQRGVESDTDLQTNDLQELVVAYKHAVQQATGKPFPEDPVEQLWGAIAAVFNSWNIERAVAYRKLHGISDLAGTAVTVMAMVYGNMGEDSGTGVVFTRNPSTGEHQLFGEFLVNAQGEDVVAGIRTPMSIQEMARLLPDAYDELMRVQHNLERHYRDMQDVEFTVERGRLYLLQTRSGKRTAAAAVRIAVDMVDEGLINTREAVLRVDPQQLDQILHPTIDPRAKPHVLVTGLPASPGAASGLVVFESSSAIQKAAEGHDVILVRPETSPDDFSGMVAARAIVTSRGGMTSHAAVVARGIGKCCVVGAHELRIDLQQRLFRSNGDVIREGEWITVDGTTGKVLLGKVKTVTPTLSAQFHQLMKWADGFRRMGVRANADTPADARNAREFGAEGIGLCRTEHMFFEGARIHVMREMILAEKVEARRKALARLLPMQREDFAGIFRAMDGMPVTIRLLDPPLHEFLPRNEEEIHNFCEVSGLEEAVVQRLVERHREANPMLGHRGVRLGISYPEITEMQARAIFEAAAEVLREGVDVRPEVMVPLVADVEELTRQKQLISRVATEVMAETGTSIGFLCGTMIELPRAALMAGEIARAADFFSFGTNDLTQTAFGISRDDAASFLPHYIESGVLSDDPFQVIDREGVGQLVQMATWEGRKRRLNLKVGICGEHGGDPRSIEFFEEVGLDYVSCSPFRVPVARLAGAHATLQHRATDDRPEVRRHSASADKAAGIPMAKTASVLP